MISLDAWRAQGTTFDWRGHRIFACAAGAGHPVLLVHGFPTSSWDWAAQWDALAARYRVLALDMIGFGFSAKPRDFDYSILAQADIFGALLAREGVTRYHLVAHDYGVSVAQELLARQRHDHEPRIASVCLLNGGLFPESHRALLTQKLLASPLGPLVARLSSYRTFAASMRRIWGTHPLPDDELRAMWALVIESAGPRVMPRIIGYIAERRRNRERWVGALTSATVPLRFINGLLDPISGAHTVARYRELVPHPDVVELPDTGHYPQVESPGVVTPAILEFLARHA
ncbi:MAG: alpha/beta hydrolase [Deltaproteobacteria bacterium]|nr:alpha/beta hydrolase [Deltaproteobacteria bacterium]